jgi:hypothetical protein
MNDLRRDFAYCSKEHRLGDLAHAALIRFQQRRARVQGFRDGWRHYRQTPTNATHKDADLCHQLRSI